jgi:hypothetical protein
MTPLGTKSGYKVKYLLQGWTAVLKAASDRTQPLFKGFSNIYVIMTQM